jgi:signal transduction histidine kinase
MDRKPLRTERQKFFSSWMARICLAGLLLNLLLSNLVVKLKLPLYLDNVGSILVAALAGALPGMFVGFLTNLINSLNNDPLSMYYGILTAVIAFLAAQFSPRGYFKTLRGCALATVCFAFIGGGIGSCMTWYLYGGGIGAGVSAPLAAAFASWGLPDFVAQLLADLLLDVPDKYITVLCVYFLLQLVPAAWADKLPFSYLYAGDAKNEKMLAAGVDKGYRRHSVSAKVVSLLVITSVVISGAAIIISSSYYSDKLMAEYENTCRSAARQIAFHVEPDQIDTYLRQGEAAPGYTAVKNHIARIIASTEGLTYAYVYQIQEDGCHVLFDIDTKDTPGAKPGDIEPFDEGFLKYKDDLLAGKNIKAVVTNDKYGRLLTVYEPIKNTAGKTVAYAGADINMNQFVQDMRIFIIKMLAMAFGITMLMCALAIWYADKIFIRPIETIVGQSEAFEKAQPEHWLESKEWLGRQRVKSGDELEELYETVSRVQENISVNVKEKLATEQKLKQTEEINRQAAVIASQNKKLELAIRRADEANAAKSTFLSQMSHDMRTPMNGILGLAELSKDLEMGPEVRDTFNKIEASGKFLLSLINDTLDMSKIEAGKIELHPETVIFGSFMQDLTDMLQIQMTEKKLQFDYELDPAAASAYVRLDRVRLQQVFFNLLSNAIKFTPAGGHIDFLTTVTGQDAQELQLQTLVRDSGIGMSQEFLEHGLFKTFSQENRADGSLYQGTGLGMAITKNLVEMMGGTVSAASAQGQGTTFTVRLTLPLVDADGIKTYQQRQVGLTTSKTVLQGKRILLCEDHPLNREITTRLLQRQGVVVESAANGELGVEMFTRANQGYYDLILMDVRMPVLDGIAATKKIRALPRADAHKIPIVAMTANAYEQDTQACYVAGMNDHLLKPVDVQLLYGMLQKYLA